MKKTVSYILITAILVPLLCGCSAGGQEPDPMEDLNIEEALDALAAADLEGKDNSLDVYSSFLNVPLQVEEPEDAVEGGGSRTFLGAARAYSFKKHLYGSVAECWDELAFVDADGEAGAEQFEWGARSWNDQLWDVGPVAGTDHYLSLCIESLEGDSCRYFLSERKEDGQSVREIPLEFLEGADIMTGINALSSFAMDSSGIVHLARYTSEGWRYQLLSTEGKIMAEYAPKDGYIQDLIPLSDGRIVFCTCFPDQNQNILQYMDAETGETVKLAAPDVGALRAYFYTLFDEDTLLYANPNGIYRSDLSGQDPEPLYLWSNHGLRVQEVTAMQADEEGRIMLIYRDSKGNNYLCLESTAEEVEICEITLAVSPYHESDFQSMVVEFNKKYPSYHITLRSDYDKTALLTELTAGSGPVLVDTDLSGFAEQEKLWQPLDSVLEQLGLTDEILPGVLDLGKLNGIQYGIVTEFDLETLITADPSLENWDYEGFLQCIEDRPDLEAIYDVYGEGNGILFFTHFLSHGFYDTFLWNAETGTTNFNSEGFRKALEIAKQYVDREDTVYAGEGLTEGKILCNEVVIHRPEDIAIYRIWFGEEAHFIGYPTKDGANGHFMRADSKIAIRRSASEKEKMAAYAFLNLCLSYEGQSQAAKDFTYNLSVRRDVLEEQITGMDPAFGTVVPGSGEIIRVGDDMDIEQDRRTLLNLIDQAKPYEYFSRELLDIIWEELEQYFAGTITEDMLIGNLENRVELYLQERE